MFKKTLFSLGLLFVALVTTAQTVSINSAQGWLESAYIKWTPISEADSYNVYYTGEGFTNQKIDTQLIRSYGNYYRADVLGLKAGQYTLKVVPVINGAEGSATTSTPITVLAHDRAGFAFSNGRVPGAYKIDGTPKDNAIILYITENTKNTVSLDVTGATSNPCVGLQTILEGFKKGKDNRPLIIRFIGQVTDMSYMQNGDIIIENSNNASSHITLEGVGDDATADGWGIRVKNATNIEIRNLGTMNCDSGEGDNIGLQQNNQYVWVHNCDFFYGDAGGDSDQAKGDGALDCKKSTYVTFSYNHFWDSGKSNLLGLSENTTSGLYITYHHNWYDHSDSRHPRVRYFSAHVYNNYYDGIAKYGIGSTEASSIFSEGNYFRNCKYPMLTSMQGSDVYDESEGSNDYSDMPTFSKEDGGTIKAFNNYIEGARRFVAYGDNNYPNATTDFDAYVVSSRNQTLSNSVTSAYGSNSYNNFDTDSAVMYNYTADSPENAKNKVTTYSGRIEGGDFTWTFNNAVDDASYDVNTGLKSALTNYNTNLVYVQGEGEAPIITEDPVVNVVATASDSSVNLSWTTANLTATAFAIYRDTDNNPSGRTKIADLAASASSYPDNTAINNTTYYYWVQANGTIDSDAAVATPTSGNNGNSSTGDQDHNFTASGTSSNFYSINGNLSSSKGTVNYAGLTLTQCLKIESSTNIGFTTQIAGNFTLVFNDGWSGSIKIDGDNYDVSSGVLNTALAAGAHTITKGDTGNLYYMSLSFEDDETPVEDPEVVLTATAGDASVILNWTSNNITTETLEVYRDTDADPSGRTRLAYIDANTYTYTDLTANNGTTYYYWIKVSNEYSSNAASATPNATETPEINLAAIAGNNSVDLNWTASQVTVTSQEVYRSTSADIATRTRIASIASDKRTYTDNTANNNTTYYYWIKINGEYNSNSASATPENEETPPVNPSAIYVATNGSASNSGTSSSPTTFEAALNNVSSGGTIYVKGGTYNFNASIIITNNGSANALITVEAYEGTPIFNFSAMSEASSNRGIVLDGDYWHFKGITIEEAGDNGMLLSGNHNIIEDCIFRKNHDTGLQLSRYNTSATSISDWPSHNLILNCEAYDNRDSDNEDADGFAAKLTCGEGNIFRGCVAHHNIDDGWDLYTKSDTGPIGIVTFEDCIAHSNGTLTTGGSSGGGDKNGFKLGSSAHQINHIVRRCIAFNNGKHGFTDNGNIGAIEFTNNTAYNNAEYNIHTRDGANHVWKNNVSFGNSQTDRIRGNNSAPNAFINVDGSLAVSQNDFETLSQGPNAQPISNGFLNLKSTSALIDAGVSASGIAYNGTAPDLGAVEFGGEITPPSDPEINLSASAGDGAVNLSWTINYVDVTSIEVYRDLDADPSGRTKLANVSATSQNYTDQTAANGTTYYYWIKVNGSLNSDAISATPNTDEDPTPSSDEIHNFTVSDDQSNFYSISGNLSDSKGTVSYNGLTLTQCLKIESSTNISFNASQAGSLTLVFNEGWSGDIKIDGTEHTVNNGLITVSLASGSHTITKADVANLYYISLTYNANRLSIDQDTITAKDIKLYPNPVANKLNLSSTVRIEKIQVYNLLGVLVKDIKGTVSNIDMSDLSQGHYLVKVFANTQVIDKIVIKQ